jgi:putative ABC transport system permease protein
MLRNYFKTAWRNIIRRKTFSLIMISGLALSMSVCLLVIVIVNDQISFDNFHPNANRIYRINTSVTRTDNNVEKIATTPFTLGNKLKGYSSIENVVHIDRDLNAEVVKGQNKIALHGMFTEPSFFKMFGFTLQAGDASTALNEPNTIVLTHQTAVKFFGNINPVGKTLSLEKFGDFKVTGVLNEITKQSQLQFDALASVASINILEQQGVINSTLNNPDNYYSDYLYVLLQKGKSEKYLNSILIDIAKKSNEGKLNADFKSVVFYAEHITGPSHMAISNNAIPSNVLWVLSILGLIVIISACFNYTNLSIASSLSRAKEIGMRKTMGAERSKIFFQFMLESVIISLLALVISIVIWRFIGTGFKEILPQLNLNLKVNAWVYLLFLLFSVFIGLIAGFFPALYLSAFKPIYVLKDFSQSKLFSKLPLRKVLLFVQFIFCCIAVISIAVISKQMNYVLNADYGFNKSNIINVELQGMQYQNIMHEIAKHSSVVEVSASSGIPGTENIDEVKVQKNNNEKPFTISSYSVDENFADNLNLHFLAGQNFTAEALRAKGKFVVVNEKALQALSLGDAHDAIGKSLILSDSNLVQIIGVVKNFNFLPLTSSIGPLILRRDPAAFRYLNVKFANNHKAEVTSFLKKAWHNFDNVHPLSFTYYSSDVTRAYQSFKSILTVLSFVGLLAVIITCMGLLGLIIFTIQIRKKEIGIRKVLGCSVVNIVILVSKSFLKLLVIASIIAIPVGYLIGYAFLQEFAYRINISGGTILMSIGLIYLIVFATICSQAIKAAIANPVESLRSE